jgi:hypothetical protein
MDQDANPLTGGFAMHIHLAIFAATSVLAGFAFAQSGDDFHSRTNSIYKELLDKGVPAGKQTLKLPAPTMPDGLDKAGQAKVLQKLAGDDYPLDELLRASIVAPHVFKFRELDAGAGDERARGVDLWFIAHGNLDWLTSKTLQGQFGGGSNRVTPIKEADLAKRNIKVKAEDGLEESYMYAVGSILDRVQISSANHGMISRTKESIVLASLLDSRFAKDADFPNQWRPITLQDDGKATLGQAQPYEGAGMYIKLTRLHEPAGAIFAELHQVFAEPKKWFDAPNMLKSKLPIVIQSEVRSFRKDLQKLKAKE